jgi:hypothetical protein
MRPEIKPCPFHGCSDVGVIRNNGFAFVSGFSCSVRGAAYSIKICGEEMAVEMAVQDWNTREKETPLLAPDILKQLESGY